MNNLFLMNRIESSIKIFNQSFHNYVDYPIISNSFFPKIQQTTINYSNIIIPKPIRLYNPNYISPLPRRATL